MADPFDLARVDDAPAAPEPAAVADYLAELNEGQRSAVEATEGAVLVLAGAGTGKTRVLTTRLAHLLATGRAWPSQILAVTFTNRAAREMRERVEALVGGAAAGLWLGTFHAIGARIVRRHAELVGLKSSFTILDQDDQIRLLKQLIQAADIDEKKAPARTLAVIIERWKSRGLSPDKVPPGEIGEFANGRSGALYKTYQARLKRLNAADFGDLLLHCLDLFTAHPDALADYHRRFRYILVDEYQDTNVAQYLWLRLLAQGQGNICCVGDDDQAIYSWRGAEVDNILRFEEAFDGARVVRLEENYRSTRNLLGAASGLIAHNAGRLGKTLRAASGEDGPPVKVIGVWDGERESQTVADEIEALRANGTPLHEIAILMRASFQTRAFEERFLALDIPYRVVGGLRFYERQEIRDAIAYMRVTAEKDDDLAFERIVNLPKRGLGTAALRTLHRIADTQRISLSDAARRLVDGGELRPQARKSLGTLIGHFETWRERERHLPLPELVGLMLEEAGYIAMWEADKGPDAPGRVENLRELVIALAEFEDLAGFLEHVGLVMDNAQASGAESVQLMTLHGAKGLEFDAVFLPGWEEGLLPHQRALDEGGNAALEEERRLAHVGLTRARKQALVSFAANRRIHNQWTSGIPSRFVDELPREHIDVVTDTGLYGGNLGGATRHDVLQTAYETSGSPARADPYGRYQAFVKAQLNVLGASPTRAKLPPMDGEFAVGDRVFHQKFGYGRIRAVDGNKLEIDFEKSGRKKVVGNFVEAA